MAIRRSPRESWRADANQFGPSGRPKASRPSKTSSAPATTPSSAPSLHNLSGDPKTASSTMSAPRGSVSRSPLAPLRTSALSGAARSTAGKTRTTHSAVSGASRSTSGKTSQERQITTGPTPRRSAGPQMASPRSLEGPGGGFFSGGSMGAGTAKRRGTASQKPSGPNFGIARPDSILGRAIQRRYDKKK